MLLPHKVLSYRRGGLGNERERGKGKLFERAIEIKRERRGNERDKG